jgi:hypothetical protein
MKPLGTLLAPLAAVLAQLLLFGGHATEAFEL